MNNNDTTPIRNPYLKKRRRPTNFEKIPQYPKDPPPFSLMKKLVDVSNVGIHVAATSNAASMTTAFSSTSIASSSASALVTSAADKAGMDGIDRKRINEIILRESGNSMFMQQQRKKDDKVNVKIESLHVKHSKVTIQDLERLEENIDVQLVPNILSRRWSRSFCVVVDMDMFYMACELLNQPHLSEKPACVGKSMILTSNYKARRYGVRSAMAGWIGDRLVEELSDGKERLVHVPSNFPLYKEQSKTVRDVLEEYDPFLRAYSLDEAYLNLGPYLAYKLTHEDADHETIRQMLLDIPQKGGDVSNDTQEDDDKKIIPSNVLISFPSTKCLEIANEIIFSMRHQVCVHTGGLTCSAGLASNFLLAKIASDVNKPNGQKSIGPSHQDITEFLHPLPTRKVPGIGRVTDKILDAFHIQTVGELYRQRALVRYLFLPGSNADALLRSSVGCCSSSSSDNQSPGSEEESATGQKGIGRERTFRAIESATEINERLEEIAHLLSEDMQRKHLWGHTITVKVKLQSFDVLSKSKSFNNGLYVQSKQDLAQYAVELLREIRLDVHNNSNIAVCTFAVRLLGIRCSNLRGDNEDTQQSTIGQFMQPISQTTTNIQAILQRTVDQMQTRVEGKHGQLCLDRFLQPTKKVTMDKHHQQKISSSLGGLVSQSSVTSKLIDETITPIFQNNPSMIMVPPSKGTVDVTGNENEVNIGKIFLNPSVLMTVEKKGKISLTVRCPICSKQFQEEQNQALNEHIDLCLGSE